MEAPHRRILYPIVTPGVGAAGSFALFGRGWGRCAGPVGTRCDGERGRCPGAVMGCGSWGIRWGGEPPRVASGPSPNVAFVRPRFMGIGEKDSMQHTVVRCAEGHVFSTASFPMQNLGRGGSGPAGCCGARAAPGCVTRCRWGRGSASGSGSRLGLRPGLRLRRPVRASRPGPAPGPGAGVSRPPVNGC